MTIERKYGVATTFQFPLIDRDAVDFENTPVTFQNSDSRISKDAGAFANTGVSPAHHEAGIYIQSLSATEMQAAQITVTFIDITATKLWEDQAVIIDTFGHVSAQHAYDRDQEGRVFGAAVGTPTTTVMDTDLTESTDSHFIGRSIIWTGGTLLGQGTDVVSYDGTTKELTYNATTEAPVATDTFMIV